MAHAKPENLETIPTILAEIRKNLLLKEKSPGCFYFKSKGVLHFHIKANRFYAHVFDGKNWIEVDIEQSVSAIKQKGLAKSILQVLDLQ